MLPPAVRCLPHSARQPWLALSGWDAFGWNFGVGGSFPAFPVCRQSVVIVGVYVCLMRRKQRIARQ